MSAPFEFLYDFTAEEGLAGSVQDMLYNGPLPPQIDERIVIGPLYKYALTNVESLNNCVAQDWPTWNDPRNEIPPTQHFVFTMRSRDAEWYKIRLGRMRFNLTRDLDGPRYFQWRASPDGYKAPLFVHDLGDNDIERGVIHDDGIITLPEEPPVDPPYFENFVIDFKQFAKTDERWRKLTEIEIRLYAYFMD